MRSISIYSLHRSKSDLVEGSLACLDGHTRPLIELKSRHGPGSIGTKFLALQLALALNKLE